MRGRSVATSVRPMRRPRTSTLPAEATRYVLRIDRKSTRLNSSHANISYAVFCLKKNTMNQLMLHNVRNQTDLNNTPRDSGAPPLNLYRHLARAEAPIRHLTHVIRLFIPLHLTVN